MLYDPKWNKEFSIVGLISWLETKDPDAHYNWQTVWCDCLIGEWRLAMGEVGESWERISRIGRQMGTSPEHSKIAMIAANGPWTYGAALERARKALANEQKP